MATQILQQCEVAPSSGVNDRLLKLLHFDMVYLPISPLRNLFLYEFQCSQSHFLDTIVPNLKNSLSLALRHFSPLAGKLLVTNDHMPVFRYVAGGDSAPLAIAVSEADFESLTAYHPREALELHDLAPRELVKYSLAAFQVTLFPNRGLCIGVTSQHLICDGVSLLGFLRMWASINRSDGDGPPDLSPVFLGRDTVADGDRLAMETWEVMKSFPSVTTSLPAARRVRATFVLSEAGIKTLQSRAFTDNMVRVSAFVVACAHLWTCLAKSAAAAGEGVSDDEAEYFSCSGDCRRHLNPPLPYTYFGNCMTVGTTESTHGELRGKDGFSSAVEAIGEAIGRMFEGGVMESSAKSLLRFIGLAGKRMLVVNGSPKLDFYGTTDYGWGRPVKFEPLQDHNAEVVFVSKSREQRGGMEITLLLPKPQMDAFAALFGEGLPMERVTLFPNKSVCVKITSHHSVGNSATLLRLLRTWSSINRTNGDGSPDVLEWLPSIERDAVTDSDRLAVEFWKASKLLPSFKALSRSPTARRVRATFVLSEEGIKVLKSRAFPDEARVSLFALASAHMWTCLARSAGAREEVEDDEAKYIIFPMSCHRLVNPPLPSNYFGNCIAPILVESTHGKLRGEDGFLAAAEAIGGAIRKVLRSSDRGIMDISYRLMVETFGVVGKKMVFIGWSARLDFYGTDFGWGRPVKFESLQDHNAELVFVSKSREYRGWMEFIVMMPKPQMDVFSAFFGEEGLPTKEKICCKM